MISGKVDTNIVEELTELRNKLLGCELELGSATQRMTDRKKRVMKAEAEHELSEAARLKQNGENKTMEESLVNAMLGNFRKLQCWRKEKIENLQG